MADSKYGIIRSEHKHLVRELLVAPHEEGALTLSFPAFGPNTYKGNLEKIGKTYSHPVTGEQISFRPAQTSESISAIAYDFANMAKPQILDPSWFQVGYIVRTQDGVFTNTTETDEAVLKQLLNGAEKVNGIYLLNGGVGFAPYDSFETGAQDANAFARGGLARVLEYTPEKVASNLRGVASQEHYKNGVNVWWFETPRESIVRVASLGSGGGRLNVVGDDWGDDYGGCAFGVLDKSRSDAPKN